MKKWLLFMTLSLLVLTACGSGDETSGTVSEPAEQKHVEEEVKLKTTLDVEQQENQLIFTLRLYNESLRDLTLPFGSGQQFEIVVKDEQGEEVYRYSADKMFTMALQMIELKAGDKMEWLETWDLSSHDVPEGTYTVEAEVMVLLKSDELPVEIDPEQLHAKQTIEISR